MISLTLIIYFVYVVKVRYFPPGLTFWHERSPLVNNMVLLLGLFILISQMGWERGKINWLWVMKEKEITRTRMWLKAVIVWKWNAHLCWDVSSGIGWNVTVKCRFNNHIIAKDLDGHDVLRHLKDHERNFVNDMTKYNMAPRYIVAALKYRDPENLTSVIQVYKAR